MEGSVKSPERSVSSMQRRLYLKQRLFTLRMKEGTPLEDHLAEFNEVISDLQAINVTFSEEDRALRLLCSLPPSYDVFVNFFLLGKETVSIAEVQKALWSLESVNNLFGDRSENDAVVSVRSNDSDPGYDPGFLGKSKSVRCYYCKKEGHIMRDCLERTDKDKGKGVFKEKIVHENHIMIMTDCDLSNEWVFDTSSTCHICPTRDWFETYQRAEGKVLLPTNTTVKIVGIGNVRLEMHDGSVKTLSDVRHVPDFKMSVICVGQLTEKGYAIRFGGDGVEVYKNGSVVVKGKIRHGLYLLEGRAIPSSVAASSRKNVKVSFNFPC